MINGAGSSSLHNVEHMCFGFQVPFKLGRVSRVLDTGLLCILDCPGTHSIEQGATKSQKPTSAPVSVGIKGVYHYHWTIKFLSLREEIEVTSIHNNAVRHPGLVISPPPTHLMKVVF